MDKAIVDKFWSHVQRGDGCWTWTKGRMTAGYGQLKIKGRQVGAHRVAWVLTNGPIADGLYVCHHCDNPICVRPDHLFVGTNSDNQKDAVKKGRNKIAAHRARGMSNHAAKITLEMSARIIEMSRQGIPKMRIGRELGVSPRQILDVVQGKHWTVTGRHSP